MKTSSEAIQDTGKKFQTLLVDEQQKNVIKSTSQYVFVSGPPGCGKTIVLAEKTLQWLLKEKTVFLVYTHGKTTNQPGIEYLWHLIENISTRHHKFSENGFPCHPKKRISSDVIVNGISPRNQECFEKDFPRLHKKRISSDINIEEFLDDVVAISNDPPLGKIPRSSKRKPEDEMFDEVCGRSVASLGEDFSDVALVDDARTTGDQNVERGGGICFVMDELSMRTITGKTTELIQSIQHRLPAAKIWSAGPFPAHCPDGFRAENLVYPYRCTPKVQRLLEALEPFCRNETSCVFQYAVTATKVPRSPVAATSEHEHTLPDDGSDPVFFSHADHGKGEIIHCLKCGENLVDYLTNTLNVGGKLSVYTSLTFLFSIVKVHLLS